MAIKYPSQATLDKYGLTKREWRSILRSQGDVCPICLKEPKTGRFVTDHEHIKGFKKMSPAEKKMFVRGVICWFCNRYFLAKGVSVFKLSNAIIYLIKYQGRNNV